MKNVIAILGTLALSSIALGEGAIITGVTAYENSGGKGCKSDAVRGLVGPDGKTITVFFDNYSAKTDKDNRIGQNSCNFGIALQLPKGITVSLDQIDYRGASYPAVNDNEEVIGSTTLYREYFFPGFATTGLKKTVITAEGPFTVTDNLFTTVVAPCGGSAVFRVNTRIEAKRPQAAKDSVSTMALDTVDLTKKWEQTFKFGWVPCPVPH